MDVYFKGKTILVTGAGQGKLSFNGPEENDQD
jgi:hypothetical protein